MTRHRRARTLAATATAAAGLLLAACATDQAEDGASDPAAADAGDDMADMEEADADGADETDRTDGEQTASESELAVDVDSSGDPYADAKGAADHVTHGARTLAGGVVAAAGFDGDVDSTSAEIRAGLTQLLQEHVYLAGFAVDAAYDVGPDSAEFGLAADALDENSVALADTVGSVAGEEHREAFLSLWRDHIGFFVDYAIAEAEGDEDAKQQARADLEGYTGDAGAFFEDITGGELPAGAVADSLRGHIDTLTEAIDGLAAGDADAFDALKGAADHVVAGAAVLAGGIAAASDADGDPDSQASQFRAGLTAALQEHVYLAGLAVKTAYAQGPDSPAFEAAVGTLDRNSVELADGIGQVAGEEQREAFLGLWRDHIDFFVDYAVATAGDDEQGRTRAVAELAGYTGDAGAFFEDVTGGELPADAVAESLRGHISTLAGAIDSLDAAIN